MKIAIMQPYFFPYIGYFQLINAVDKFVIYDNIKFTKKGWINRNRILVNGEDQYFTIPLKKDSDFLDIGQRILSDDHDKEKGNIIRKLNGAYAKAPYLKETMEVVEPLIRNAEIKLFDYLLNTVKGLCHFLDIKTEFIVSSTINADHDLKSQDRVIDIARNVGADHYINPIGGLELYDKASFAEKGIRLEFLRSGGQSYKQFGNEFVPWLSIIDVMMFNQPEVVKEMVNKDFVVS